PPNCPDTELNVASMLMKFVRLLMIPTAFLLVAGAWIWWSYPSQVDMTSYVPSESLLYLEVNNLPRIAKGIVDTSKGLSIGAQLKSSPFRVTWIGRLARWTGIGTTEEVILARSQFAMVILALDATDDQPTLRIRPAAALLIETHTSQRRMRPAIEKQIEQLARRVYAQVSIKRKNIDGIEFVEWVSQADGRSIVATFLDSLVIVGNDELAVQACVAARRGTRPSLASNKDLSAMRDRLRGDSAAAFGYVSSDGLGKLLAFAAPLYVDRLSTSSEAQRILASLAGKLFQSAGWAAGFEGGRIEDRYFVSLPHDVASNLREAFAAGPTTTANAIRFLPADTYSFTRYNLRDPLLAWRGLNKALSSHVDILGAVMITPLLKAALSPYGIDDPDTFLGAVGSEIVTVRLDEGSTPSVLIVQPHDPAALQRLISKRLGAGVRRELVGGYEMLVSSDESDIAASFADEELLIGPPALVGRCLLARSQQSTLDSVSSYKLVSRNVPYPPPLAITYSRDLKSAQDFLSIISGRQVQPISGTAASRPEIPYAVSATAFTDEGFEKRTNSTFGFFGTLAAQFDSQLSGK
ncbi:MAG: hypothetical protein ABI923_06360, partial [bacterium]